MSIEFVLPTSRNFYNPFLTVSSDHIMGERRIEIRSDVPVSPVWILQGPADSVIASLPEENLQWVFGPVLENETITIDTDNSTISNQDDENRIDGLDWPQSSFFELPPGNILLNVNMSGVGSSTGPPAGVRLTYKPRREMA